MNIILFIINAILCGSIVFITSQSGELIFSLFLSIYLGSIMGIYGSSLWESYKNDILISNTEAVLTALFSFCVVEQRRVARRITRKNLRALKRSRKAHRKAIKHARRIHRLACI